MNPAGEPDLTVVVTCFNEGAMLLDAVASAEANGRGRHEILVVNGGSTDPATLAAVATLARRGVRVLNEEDHGPSAARNAGIRQARGRYILPLDADNLLRPAYLDRGIDILDAVPSVDVVYGDMEYFGGLTGRRRVPEFSLLRLIGGNYIDTCAVYRKSVWERVGGYDEHIPGFGADDWDFWVRVATSGSRFHHVNEVLFDYRVHHQSLTMRQNRTAPDKPWEQYLRAKSLPMTWGQFSDAVSWRHTVDTFRAAPVRTVAKLVAQAYLPGVQKWWQRLRGVS